jgi:hypothetical protein
LPAGPATAAGFGEFDSDPFLDLAVAVGSDIEFIHGWGRKTESTWRREEHSRWREHSRSQHRFYVWNREGKQRLAMMTEDGAVHLRNAEPE